MAARPDPYGLKTDPQRQMKMMMEHKKNFDGGVQSRLPTVTNSNAHGARSNSEVRLKPRQIAKQDNSYMDESSVNTTLMSEHQTNAPSAPQKAVFNRGSKFSGRQAHSLDKRGYNNTPSQGQIKLIPSEYKIQSTPRDEGDYNTDKVRHGMGDPILMRKIMRPKPWIQRNDKELQKIFLVEIAGNRSIETMNVPDPAARGDLLDEQTKRAEIKRVQQKAIETTKINRHQIQRYLERRYTEQMTEKIMNAFQFTSAPKKIKFQHYCDYIDSFLNLELQDQKRLAFQLHDFDDNGYVSIVDIQNVYNHINEQEKFICNLDKDLESIVRRIRKQETETPVNSGANMNKNVARSRSKLEESQGVRFIVEDDQIAEPGNSNGVRDFKSKTSLADYMGSQEEPEDDENERKLTFAEYNKIQWNQWWPQILRDVILYLSHYFCTQNDFWVKKRQEDSIQDTTYHTEKQQSRRILPMINSENARNSKNQFPNGNQKYTTGSKASHDQLPDVDEKFRRDSSLDGMQKSKSKSSMGNYANYFHGPKGPPENAYKTDKIDKIMKDMTQMSKKVDESTKIIINGSEVLNRKGISGQINEIGVGFGTARNTSMRKKGNKVPIVVYEVSHIKKQRTDSVQPNIRRYNLLDGVPEAEIYSPRASPEMQALKKRKMTQPPSQEGRNMAWSGQKGNFELTPLDEEMQQRAQRDHSPMSTPGTHKPPMPKKNFTPAGPPNTDIRIRKQAKQPALNKHPSRASFHSTDPNSALAMQQSHPISNAPQPNRSGSKMKIFKHIAATPQVNLDSSFETPNNDNSKKINMPLSQLRKHQMHEQFVIEHSTGVQPHMKIDSEPDISAPYETARDQLQEQVESVDSKSLNERQVDEVQSNGPAEVVSDFEEEPEPQAIEPEKDEKIEETTFTDSQIEELRLFANQGANIVPSIEETQSDIKQPLQTVEEEKELSIKIESEEEDINIEAQTSTKYQLRQYPRYVEPEKQPETPSKQYSAEKPPLFTKKVKTPKAIPRIQTPPKNKKKYSKTIGTQASRNGQSFITRETNTEQQSEEESVHEDRSRNMPLAPEIYFQDNTCQTDNSFQEKYVPIKKPSETPHRSYIIPEPENDDPSHEIIQLPDEPTSLACLGDEPEPKSDSVYRHDSIKLPFEPDECEDYEPPILFMPKEPATDTQQNSLKTMNQLSDKLPVSPLIEIEENHEKREIRRDWAQSKLFIYMYNRHTRHLIDSQLITLHEGETRPETPKEFKKLSEKQQITLILNPNKLKILTEMECEYMASVLRKKSVNLMNNLDNTFKESKQTFELLGDSMIDPDTASYILDANYTKIDRQTVIKLLMRAKLFYEARTFVSKIFKYIIELEAILRPKSTLWSIMQDNGQEELDAEHADVIKKTLELLSKALAQITIFQTENKLFSGEFYFRRTDYREYIRQCGSVLSGFLATKKLPNPTVLINGSIIEEHDETDKHLRAYIGWREESFKTVGQLSKPKEIIQVQTIIRTGRGRDKAKTDLSNYRSNLSQPRDGSQPGDNLSQYSNQDSSYMVFNSHKNKKIKMKELSSGNMLLKPQNFDSTNLEPLIENQEERKTPNATTKNIVIKQRQFRAVSVMNSSQKDLNLTQIHAISSVNPSQKEISQTQVRSSQKELSQTSQVKIISSKDIEFK